MRFLVPLLVIIIIFFCAILMAQEYTNYYPYYDPGYYSYSGEGWGYPQCMIYGCGFFSPFYNFDPLSNSLLGLGMFAGALM